MAADMCGYSPNYIQYLLELQNIPNDRIPVNKSIVARNTLTF